MPPQPSLNIILVLGAQNDLDGTLSPMARERALRAVDEFRRTPNTRLLLTSGYGHFNRSTQPHACHVARFITGHGVSRDHILPFVLSTNTVEDAALSARLLRDYAVASICVITSELHVERAKLIFEHFFDPALLSFAGAPNGVADEAALALIAHESTAIQQIRSQGGVLFDGRLHTSRGNRP